MRYYKVFLAASKTSPEPRHLPTPRFVGQQSELEPVGVVWDYSAGLTGAKCQCFFLQKADLGFIKMMTRFKKTKQNKQQERS